MVPSTVQPFGRRSFGASLSRHGTLAGMGKNCCRALRSYDRLALRQSLKQVSQLLLNAAPLIHGSGDFFLHQVAKSFAQPVNSYFDRSFAQTKLTCGVSL